MLVKIMVAKIIVAILYRTLQNFQTTQIMLLLRKRLQLRTSNHYQSSHTLRMLTRTQTICYQLQEDVYNKLAPYLSYRHQWLLYLQAKALLYLLAKVFLYLLAKTLYTYHPLIRLFSLLRVWPLLQIQIYSRLLRMVRPLRLQQIQTYSIAYTQLLIRSIRIYLNFNILLQYLASLTFIV